jgi:hypothetical protein
MLILPPVAKTAGSSRVWGPAHSIHIWALGCMHVHGSCPAWPGACLGWAWVHQTGTPPHDSYVCLQRCGLQAQSRVLLQCISSCACEEHDLLLSPNLLPFAGSIQTSNSCSKCSSHLQIGRPSNTIISHLPLARSLERVSELVYIIKRLRTENQSPHTGHHLPPRKL